MQWSKRIIFFVTLVAFLSNLAFGMSLPLVREHNVKLAVTTADHAQYKKSSNEYLPFSTCAFLEEMEEAEQETDFDEFPVFEQLSIDHLCISQHFWKTNFRETTHPEFTGRNFRNWLFRNSIIIYFQVFRI